MHQRTKTIILYDFELFADCKADSRHPGFITPGLAWPGEELFYQTAQLVAIGAEAFRSSPNNPSSTVIRRAEPRRGPMSDGCLKQQRDEVEI